MNESIPTEFHNSTMPNFGVSVTEQSQMINMPIYIFRQKQNEGPLSPAHYIIIVLIIYMGGIAALVMKSVQRDNEVQRYQHYYENFVKRPQFSRPKLLPPYTLRKTSYKSRVDRGSSTPSHVEIPVGIGSEDPYDTLHSRQSSPIAETKINIACSDMLSVSTSIIVNAMPASTQTDPV